jgi:heme/copper-type cytochrome/quinol oxidase subunit 2
MPPCSESLGSERNVLSRPLIVIPLVLLVLVGLFFLLRPASPPENVPTTDESTTEETQEKTFDLAIAQNTMTPSEITVTEGDPVVFRITSESPLAFHLHGYDLETEVEPGEPTELSFDATITGRFEIENEQTREELGALLVQPR